MKVYKIGSTHKNNQDFAFEYEGLKAVLDGCSKTASGESVSEVGSRVFGQMLKNTFLAYVEEKPVEEFIANFDDISDKIMNTLLASIYDMGKKLNWSQEMLKEFINSNLCFTTLLCFELPDKFVVKTFGDGYIVTINKAGKVSYIKLYYGKYPPYVIYNHNGNYPTKKLFKTFEFSKADFLEVGVASDGIETVTKVGTHMTLDKQKEFDSYLLNADASSVLKFIEENHKFFTDDTTIAL